MPKKKSIKTLKRTLDAAFSIYIRKRDADPISGNIECVTCGRVSHWSQGHAGHFIKRQHTATRYDDRNCHFQDAYCNTYRGGALIEYTLYMQKRYGVKVVEELMRLKNTTVKYTRSDFEDLIAKFSQAL